MKIINYDLLIQYDFSKNDLLILENIYFLLKQTECDVYLFGRDKLCRYLFNAYPLFKTFIKAIVVGNDQEYLFETTFFGLDILDINVLDNEKKIIFVTDKNFKIEKKFGNNVKILTLDTLGINLENIPEHAKFYNVRKIHNLIEPLNNEFFRFIPNKLFKYDYRKNDEAIIQAITKFVRQKDVKLINFDPKLFSYIREYNVDCIDLEDSINAAEVFLLATDIETIQKAKSKLKKINKDIIIYTFDILLEIDPEIIPSYAWNVFEQSIYPIEIPEIKIKKELDFLLLDLPAKKDASMPNGLAYVHNALKKIHNLKFQTIDYDVILYHTYHQKRILDGENYRLKNGEILPDNLWLEGHSLEWDKEELMDFFAEEIEKIASDIIKAAPKIIGVSLHFSNILFTKKVITKVKQALPEVIIVSGGMNCTRYNSSQIVFPESDYIVVGEADITLPLLLNDLFVNKIIPKNIPGIISKNDDKNRVWSPGQLPYDLDTLEAPNYDWFEDISIYTRFNGYKPAQVITSRGCHWAKCTFCAECFVWRQHSAIRVVDEIEWLTRHGFYHFSFNESDFNGDPEKIKEVCLEILRRDLKITMIGQLRIDHRNTVDFMKLMKEAGFSMIRFGVDGWSKKALRYQKKGYSKRIITQNLKACKEAGLIVNTNMVIGVPGEEECDVDEAIEFALEHKRYINQMEFIHSLMLIAGSQYYENPEIFNIEFRSNKEELYIKYPHYIPNELWYSVNPYIDDIIRQKRFEKICIEFFKNGLRIGPRPKFIAESILKGKTIEEIAQGKLIERNT